MKSMKNAFWTQADSDKRNPQTRLVITLIMAIAMMVWIPVIPSLAANTVASGTCGDNLTWVLDDDGALTISGNGAMDDYEYDDMPWYNYKDSINELIVQEGVTTIGSNAFREFESLANISFGKDLQSIGEWAFIQCTNLDNVIIPEGVTSIMTRAFKDCSKLTNVTISDSVSFVGGWAFDGTPWLESQGEFAIVNGILIEYQGEGGDVVIPEGVTYLGDYSFLWDSSIENVIIPEGVHIIGDSVFNECTGLGSVSLPETLEVIESNAFVHCSSLSELVIPANVKKIKRWAFGDAIRLHTITFKGDLPEIASDAFYSVTADAYYPSYWKKIPESDEYTGGNDGCLTWIPYDITPDAPKLAGISNASSGVTVKWNKVDGADGYRVYRKAEGETKWSSLKTIAKGSTVKYTDQSVKSGTKYTYTVRAYKKTNDVTTWGSYNKTGKTILYISQPSVQVANASSGITVKWGKVTGAGGYRVYRKAEGETKWTSLKTITSGSTVKYTDKTVKSGTKYTYTVRAYKKENGVATWSSYNTTGMTMVYLSQPSVKAASASKGITVSWSKVSGAGGYRIYRKAEGETKWTSLKTITKGSTVKYTDQNVKNGKKYTYTVRAYKKADGTTMWSSYSASGVTVKYVK